MKRCQEYPIYFNSVRTLYSTPLTERQASSKKTLYKIRATVRLLLGTEDWAHVAIWKADLSSK